jgi:energy-coupling factor transporter ATP-binding protein EcfA2
MGWTSRLYGQDSIFQSIRESFNDMPHIFLTGPPGCGKSTFLEDLIELMKAEAPFKIESVLWLSSEKDRGIHTIRDKVNDFCKRTHSTPNTLRWIVIDDADTLPLISQQALRRPMETFNHLTRFLFASRYSGNLIEPLRSRCLTLEIEPISPIDAVPLYMKKYHIQEKHMEELKDFCIRNFIGIGEVKSVLKLYKSYDSLGLTNPIEHLKSLLPSSIIFTNTLIISLGNKDDLLIRESITNLYLHGYLLDDILLAVEKSISLFPSIDPTIRFRVLQFTMLGWISIQQGKEHWLDTMDLVEQVLKSE